MNVPTIRRTVKRLLASASLVLIGAIPVVAHPHIFIDAQVTIVFDGNGAVSGLRHGWTFDAAFSSWVVQGLDTDGDGITSPEELQELADENLAGLAEFGFYTFAGAQDAPMAWEAAGDQRMVYADGKTTLSYSVLAETPEEVRDGFELGIYDPEYYVAITVPDAGSVHLENAPAGCSAVVEPPRPMDRAVEERLYALGPDVLELPPDLAAAMRGTQGLIRITCPAGDTGGEPANAAEAAEAMAQARPATPFGGPPAEPSLSLPRSGFFGWLQQQQRNFYQAMTASLDAVRSDWTAFWLLGGLSFLYGVFHAAGPGHGKVVISSYMLANETQLRRGIRLSVVSAMLQSVVAVALVLVAAGALGMTSLAMGNAANWIGIGSYALIALLGLWLVLRKLLGWGHDHDHDHDHDQDHHHDHAHERGHAHAPSNVAHRHAHIVAPQATSGGWREQLAVVLAVGLRPCSGALVVMVFALSQGVLAAGIAAVFLMGLGTAITVAALASVAVGAKGLARRLGGAENPVTVSIVWWAELLGAFAVLGFGVVLLLASL